MGYLLEVANPIQAVEDVTNLPGLLLQQKMIQRIQHNFMTLPILAILYHTKTHQQCQCMNAATTIRDIRNIKIIPLRRRLPL